MHPDLHAATPASRSEGGFSLIETMIAMAILLIVSAGMTAAMFQFSNTQSTVFNRSGMHNAVRSATELLQQEVGQAGAVTLPAAVTMTSAVLSPALTSVQVTSTAGMFPGQYLVIDTGPNEETVAVTAIGSATVLSANFTVAHAANVPITVRGGFASGVIPAAGSNVMVGTNTTPTALAAGAGSDGSHLKLYGDVNGDGTVVYVEYLCDTQTTHTLYRRVFQNVVKASAPFTVKPSGQPPSDQVLLDNIWPNPDNTPCFTYRQVVVENNTYVINVAISLTTQTQQQDRVTRQFQQETKALLNVSPRNIFDTWLLASMAVTHRVQPMPASLLAVLPNVPGW